jgi:hypothetical protein
MGGIVDRDGDARLGILAQQGGIGDALVTQLLASIGRVRDQFAKKNVFVRIDRMHHHVQQFRDIGLEGMGLGARSYRWSWGHRAFRIVVRAQM